MTNDEYVKFRMENGSMCAVCPANAQRRVGCDGPMSAAIVGIGEAPGEDEEKWGRHRGARYGTPFVGATGYKLRRDNLGKAGLIDVVPTSRKPYPELRNLRAFLMNVVMCRPSENKIDSPVGRVMVKCCENSLYAFLERMLEENPNRTLVAIGATAATALRRRTTKIDAHRGRVTHIEDVERWKREKLTRTSEAEILKKALRGKKPREEWWPRFEKTLKAFLSIQRRGLAGAAKRLPVEMVLPMSIVKLVLQKQRAALKTRAAQRVKENV